MLKELKMLKREDSTLFKVELKAKNKHYLFTL